MASSDSNADDLKGQSGPDVDGVESAAGGSSGKRLSVDEEQFERLSNSPAAAKVKTFPQTPGVYLMKDSAGIVIYVGKAKTYVRVPVATFSKLHCKNLARRFGSWRSSTSIF